MSSVEFGSRIASDHPQNTCDRGDKSSESAIDPTATRGARHRNVKRSPSNTSYETEKNFLSENTIEKNTHFAKNKISAKKQWNMCTWSWSGLSSSNGCNGVSQCKSWPTFNFFTKRPRKADGVSHFGGGCSFTDIFDDHGISHSKLQSHANGLPEMFLHKVQMCQNYLIWISGAIMQINVDGLNIAVRRRRRRRRLWRRRRESAIKPRVCQNHCEGDKELTIVWVVANRRRHLGRCVQLNWAIA